MSRIAWVIHISAVTLVQTTRKAPRVVRKMYRPMDPIRLRVPARNKTPGARGRYGPPGTRQPVPLYGLPDRPTKWLGQGKAFEHAQQIVNSTPAIGTMASARQP